ncbi:MAG TPA: biopolymer transporter ExbD [Phycisphaerales bacterium]|nr:biopolymer transporter ExbD [Phycisphaerales bacterium]
MLIRRSQRKEFQLPRLPLAAFIDVTLFLLLYFILASNFAKEESWLDSTISTDRRGAAAGNLQPQIVTVGVNGDSPLFRLGDRFFNDRGSLEAVLRQLPKDDGVFIKVPGDVPVWAATMALQAARDAGFHKVSYVPAK